MNYELSLCFLFIILITIYFYFKNQPILEGAGKSKKKAKDPFKDLGKQILKPITKILKPITDGIKKMTDFFKCLGKYNKDWVDLIKNSVDCGVKYLNPACYHLHIMKIIGGALYGIGWIIALPFNAAKQYDKFISKIQTKLWNDVYPNALKKSYDKCYKCKSLKIPEFCGKKKKANKPVKKLDNTILDLNNSIENQKANPIFWLFIIPIIFLIIFFIKYSISGTSDNTVIDAFSKTPDGPIKDAFSKTPDAIPSPLHQ